MLRWSHQSAFGVCAAVLAVTVTASMPASPEPLEVASRAPGRVLIFPGIHNTQFHLRSFARRVAEQLPNVEVEIRPWGKPLLGLGNLRARSRNRQAARALADDIAGWRRAHPDELLYLIGYSGGGGIAALTVAALPADIQVDRLILVAPAISADFDCARHLLPRIDDFVVNFASRRDLQVGLGTRVFGTIDGVKTRGAGHAGFTQGHERVVEWRWTQADLALGHRGNHVSYLGRRWQDAALMPALDPRRDAESLRAAWHERHVEDLSRPPAARGGSR